MKTKRGVKGTFLGFRNKSARHRLFFAGCLAQRQWLECDATQPTNGVDNVATDLIVAHVLDILILVMPILSAPPIGFSA
jgi:hypothetical protein